VDVSVLQWMFLYYLVVLYNGLLHTIECYGTVTLYFMSSY